MEASEQRLLEILGGIAMYNDKGFEWNKHSTAQVEHEREKAFTEIQKLVSEIGEERFPEGILFSLRSQRPVIDPTGQYKQAVAQCLSIDPSA